MDTELKKLTPEEQAQKEKVWAIWRQIAEATNDWRNYVYVKDLAMGVLHKTLTANCIPIVTFELKGPFCAKKGDYLDAGLTLNGGGQVIGKTITLRNKNNFYMIGFVEGFISISDTRDATNCPYLTLVSYGSEAFVREVMQWMDKHLVDPSLSECTVLALINTQSGPQFTRIGNEKSELIRDNYSDEVLAKFDRIVASLKDDKPAGRINILNGTPGSGKTHLCRGMISEMVGGKVCIVQASMIANMAGPSLLPALLTQAKDGKFVFFIEDAEECLATRDAGNNSAVSTLLNLGDGILGSLLDIRIVATTNCKVQDLDPAISRPGRLNTICEVDAHTFEKAEEIYCRLTGSDCLPAPEKDYTLAEIYQMAGDADWKKAESQNKKKVGFGA